MPLMWFMKAGNAQPALVYEYGPGFGSMLCATLGSAPEVGSASFMAHVPQTIGVWVFGNWNWPRLFVPRCLLRYRAEAWHEIATDDNNLNLANRGRSKTIWVTRFLEEAGIANTSIINS